MYTQEGDGSSWLKTSAYTATKQEHLTIVANTMCRISAAIRSNPVKEWSRRVPYPIIDAFSGPGVDCGPHAARWASRRALGHPCAAPCAGCHLGSPAILLDAMVRAGLPGTLYCLDKEPVYAQRLSGLIVPPTSAIEVVPLLGDTATLLPALVGLLQARCRAAGLSTDWLIGFLYADPYGVPRDQWLSGLRLFGRLLPRIDMFLHLPSTSMLRTLAWPPADRRQRVSTIKEVCAKDRWFVRRPAPRNASGWIFLLGTNFPDMRAIREAELVDCDTPEGRAILAALEPEENGDA